jgi:C4-dicarboxylate-specific signal transduction histidine kinase
MSCVLVRDRHGKVTGVLAMARDITARLQAEAAQQELQKQLVQASRRAGMADVAANVLHNVGNVLNSVNISAGLVTNTMRQSLIGDVGRIAAMLHEHAPALGDYLTSDPKGKQIPTYLVALGDHLTQERASVLTELSSLGSKIEHIRQIISMQQGFTTKKDGHGLGLHSAALAARMMGGSLRVHSDGERQGATFTLDLPLKPVEDHV